MQNYQFRLIDSNYGAQEANEVLTSLIQDKIRFLNQKCFSLEERFGSDTAHLKKRIKELQAEKRTLDLILEEFDRDEAEFQISCTVQMVVRVPETDH